MAATRVLVVAAHPDDEVLGCGGAIARHCAEGAAVSVLIMADGVGSRTGGDDAAHSRALSARKRSADRAAEILGVHEVTLLSYGDNRMDGVELLDVVQDIEKLVREFAPGVVYTHHGADVNVDHRIVHDAVVAACRPLPDHPVRQLLFFETPSSTEWRPPGSFAPFVPNWFVDVGATLDKKLAALEAYSDELRDFPHPRSLRAVEHLARWRGATAGLDAAEAFELGRHIL